MSQTNDKFYDPGSWELYRSTIARHAAPGGMQTPDFGAYLPDPDEVLWRMAVVKWLGRCGFSEVFMDSVMTHDTPPLIKVMEQWHNCGCVKTIEARWDSVLVRGGDDD